MTRVSSGVVHKLPSDVRSAIVSDPVVHEAWEDITPLARNEFICWIISAKKEQTRTKRIDWMCSDLRKGKRRPCCWAGCSHREKSGNANAKR